MSDLFQFVGTDLSGSAAGDVLPVDGMTLGQQRILRRLLTNPGDYIFHPDYGAGLPRYVGAVVDIPKIRALIAGQIQLESCVAKTPAPQIEVRPISNGIAVSIQYTDAQTSQTSVLTFDVNQ